MSTDHVPDWLTAPLAPPDAAYAQRAQQRQQQLTKPAGALGRLESLAIQLAAMQRSDAPTLQRVQVSVFAADHGVADEGISAYPQSVTAQMIANFTAGGAAVNALAREFGASLEIIHLGTVSPVPRGTHSRPIAAATSNMTQGEAMSGEQMQQALSEGRLAADRAVRAEAQLFIGGEMGIGNTTAATAMSCALLGAAPAALAGPGTGLDASGVAHKVSVISRALQLHRSQLQVPLAALRCVGGFEIAALTGSYIACAQHGLPVLVDGFISSVAALQAVRVVPGVRDWLLFSHRSAEPGHAAVLAAMQAETMLDFGMRLGEGSGALVALPLLRAACATHNGMATFAEAGVAQRREDSGA